MKKFLISTSLLSIIVFSSFYSFCFAADVANNVKNTAGAIGQSVGDASNHAKNAVQNTANMAGNAMKSASNTVMGTTGNVANGVKTGTNDAMNGLANMDSDYDAQKTAGDASFMGMSTTSWTWLIIAIVGIAIVALVWFYGRQYEHTDFSDGE